jgi:hypothetical protein
MTNKPTTESYNIISFVCFLLVATPILLFLYLGTETKYSTSHQGMVRLEPGKLFVKNMKSAEANPNNQAILVAEGLNKHVAEIAIQSPGNKEKIKNSNADNIFKTLDELSITTPNELIRKAQARTIKWAPSIGSNGLFILEFERRPSRSQSFGLIELPGGKEKSIFLTEKKVNSILHKLRERKAIKEGTLTTEDLVNSALRTRPPLINPTEGVEIIGLCYGLNITYNEDLELFLSNDTINEMAPWQKELTKN